MAVLKMRDPDDPTIWHDVAGAGPTGPTGPLGPTGGVGDEIIVSPAEPTGPLTDFWYDPSGGTTQADHTPYVPLQIKAVASFTGPWDLEGSADTIFNGFIPGQQYLVIGSCSGMAAATGMKYVDVAVDGTNIMPIGMWFNQLNIHTAFPMTCAFWRATLESHTFGFRAGSGAPTSDGNDKATLIIIPCAG